ncbi:uncharacterized protein LOC129987514 [Argiope bruennichi]|uniref:uncharacterized protein LOC129987514 n=1 Tax=Argiope bruennichi TaxID=94029 RepID=UPI002495898F|nr:uncharacterized protein LOC129987514 [Argiope bruennichi]
MRAGTITTSQRQSGTACSRSIRRHLPIKKTKGRLTIFFDVQGLLLVEFLEHRRNINSDACSLLTSLSIDAYWSISGNIEHVDYGIPLQVDEYGRVNPIILKWNRTLAFTSDDSIRIILSTGLTSKSLERTISSLLVNILEPKITLKSNRTPRCLPSNYKDLRVVRAVFVDDEFVLEGSVSYRVSIFIYQWVFPDGSFVTGRSSASTFRIVYSLKTEGLHEIHLIVTSSRGEAQTSLLLVALQQVYVEILEIPSQFILVDTTMELLFSATVTNTKAWKLELKCNNELKDSFLIPHMSKQDICDIADHTFKWEFHNSGKYQCWLYSTDGIVATSSGRYIFIVFPRLIKALIETKKVITTNETVTFSVNILSYLDHTNSVIKWRVLKENDLSIIYNNKTQELLSVSYIFKEAGNFIVQVIASNPFSQVQNETLVTVYDPITDLVIHPYRSVMFIKATSEVQFAASFSAGTDAHCTWIVHCTCSHLLKKNFKFGSTDCKFIHRFVLYGVCNVSLSVTNKVSSVRPRTPWKIFVEEPVTDLQAYVPDVVQAGSVIKVQVFLPHFNYGAHAVIRTKSQRIATRYEPETSIYEAELTTENRKNLEWLRIRAFNNVSYDVQRRPVLIIPEIGRVSIHSSGCLVTGNSAKFLVLIDGNIPSEKDRLLYKWTIQFSNGTTSEYTSVPLLQTVTLLAPGILTVSVTVSNKVSERNSSISLQVKESLEEPCFVHEAISELGKAVEFELLGFIPASNLMYATLKLRISKSTRSFLVAPQRIQSPSSYRWRYIFPSSGFYSIMAQVFLEYFDFISTNLTFQSGIHVQQRFISLHLAGPEIVCISRIPLNNEWFAKVVPFSYGNIFIWSLPEFDEIISADFKLVTHQLHPGTNELKVTVKNSFGHLNASMLVQAAVTLIALNYSFSDFFVGQNGTFSVTINQPVLPDAVFVDFGDGHKFDSSANPSMLLHEIHGNSSTFTVTHAYQAAGLHIVYINASNTVSHLEHWTTVDVAIPISGVTLKLLSPSIVALFEEVVVQCLVEKGSDIDFDWDFGDDTDGQYTTVNSTSNSSVAIHSYGVADTYNITVHVFNNYETVTAHLNVSIQAVEPIEKLHLRPIFDQYAAALHELKPDKASGTAKYATDPIVFEAWVWRGSDIQFLFDFGDGQTKLVSSELNVWSLPCATVKHIYTAEGIYSISVTATNPLDSVNQNLSQPFFVQFAPKGLKLDRQYYIIQYMHTLKIFASVSQGTNISFVWTLDNEQLIETGGILTLDSLRPGVHVVSVEVFNKVTDFAYKTVTRPSASSKIYVQEKLQELSLCVLHNSEEWCQGDELELPLDEEIIFVAKVLPNTERSLRFTWQVGIGDLKRTNKPFLHYMYPSPGRFIVNVTAQNHISMVSSPHLELHLVQKIANLTSIHCQGPNLVNHVITFRALYWFGTNLTFQWDFGDGSPIKITHSPSIQHIYKEVGEYWVSVNVWNKFSHANISTNMFFLHHFCQKPEITFLQQTGQVFNYADDILIEAEILTNCETSNVKYNWTIKKENGSLVLFDVSDMLLQRHLIIPQYYLKPGRYNIHLKVEMSGFIVYAESSTTLEIQFPNPVAFIKGGYVRLIGSNDSIKLETNIITMENTSQSVNYTWSCSPLTQRHLSCFQENYLDSFSATITNSFVLSASHLTRGLSAVIINSTIQGQQLVSASQIIEIRPAQHVLITTIDSEVGYNHQINQDSKIRMKANCQNCSGHHVEYEWKVWKIEGEMHKMHYSNYECVQADGSTFFIMSPNTTLISENNSYSFHNIFQDNIKESYYGSTNQLISEDLPPFPNLPGFPEELNFSHSRKRLRSVRHSPHESMIDPPDFTPFQSYPFEENAHYDINSTFFNLSYPDFLPVSPHGDVLGGLDYPIPEEGAPGESGSAIARDQSSHRFKIYLSENEGQIEEGAGKPRIDGSHVFVHETDKMGDPVRDPRLHEIPTVTHLLNRPRNPLFLSRDNTTTGFNSEYFILKPGVLRAGHSYLIEVITKDKNHAVEGSAMELLLINAGPANGRCTLMPTQGYSLNFNFRLHCMEWKSDHQPLYYELRYSLTPTELGHLIYFGLNRNAKFVLPSGLDSESFNVYLNVIIRNNVGASTKVCSIVREVKPLHLNTTLIQYIYNETFHPQSQLAKYLGEKQNQALLHQIHVLSSSLNNQDLIKSANKKDKILKEQIRFRFLEAIEHLKILSKVEAVQILSCLSEIITDTSEITMFELQKVYNIYTKLQNLKSELYGFTSEVLQHEFLVLLSKLMFASHSVYLRNEELIRIGRQQLAEEIKDLMKLRLKIEEPLIIEVPHIFICGLYLLNVEQKLGLNAFQIPLKLTEVQFLGGFNSTFNNKRIKRCSSDGCKDDDSCIALIAQEFDYVSMPHYLNFAQLLPTKKTSILLSVLSCDKLKNFDSTANLNFSVRFSRNHENEMTNRALLSMHHTNFHQINITDDDINHSYLFHVKMDSGINGSENFQLEALFRHGNWPTPKKYSWKQKFVTNAEEHSFFISQDHIKVPGIYYFAVYPQVENKHVKSNEILTAYSIFIWKEVCLGKSRGIWSTQNCFSSETSNYVWSDCKCSALEITAYSIPFTVNTFQVPLKDLMEPYFNFVPIVIFIAILLVYFILLVLNFYKDKMKNISCSPVPLIDNNNKHKQMYLVCVKTGMYYSAGTTASVFIVLHGTKGMTETRQLIDSKAEKYYFQKGAIDLFLMSTEKNLGPLTKLEVWHNNHGPSPSWYLKEIIIKDLKTGFSYDFECYKWLSAEKGDGQIERELTLLERKPSFCSIFWDSFVNLIHDFNMWNSVICESPTSFFTGVQRLSCCLCFYLNCSLLFAVLLEQIFEKQPVQENVLPHISESTFPLCLSVSAAATLPQIILTLLFRFSKMPSVNVDPKFNKVFCFLSLHHLYCWLRQKRSNSSHSSDRSASSLGESDSFYSSFEESSIMSIPELMEESFSTEGKDEFPTSVSSMSINDPVSPLQKTLSTWQAFENWVRKKHDLIKSDVMSGRQQISTEKSDSVLIPEEIMLEDLEHNEDDSNQSNDSVSLSSENSRDRLEITNFIRNDAVLSHGLNLYLHIPFLHSSFYYVAWVLLTSNILLAGTMTAIKISSFSFTKCTFWMKYTFLSQLCSFMIIIPSLILLMTIIVSIKRYLGYKVQRQLASDEQPLQETDSNEINKMEPSYKRIEYFKKYLRPPKEQILEQFRLYAMKEKYIFNLQSSFWQYVAIFVLLLLLLLPIDTRNRYLQKTSILNSLFRQYGQSVAATPVKSSLELYDWFEFDFIDRFYGRSQCFDPNLDCAITVLTGCSVVGRTVIRLFKSHACHDGLFSTCKYNSLENTSSNNTFYHYEHRLLKGHFGAYNLEDKLVILQENPEEAQHQIDLFLSHLFNVTSGAVSIEFLLFNPTFSTLISVSLLFELTEFDILFSKEILFATLSEPTSFQYHANFALHLLFMLIILVNYKNMCWRILKYGLSMLIKSWDCFSALFNVVSTMYISVYIIYMLQFRHILSTLAEKNFHVNLNIAMIAYFETLTQQLLSFLIFLHLIHSIRILCFSPRLKRLLHIITKSWKIILSTFFIFMLLISICDLMTRHFIGVTDKLSHPLINCIKGMGSIFRFYKKPEIVDSDSSINKVLSTIILFFIVAIHVVLLSFLRSVLIKNKTSGHRVVREKITLKDTKKVLKRKLTSCFKPPSPHVVAKDDYVLPVDFLLIELEQLADSLLTKANDLFSEYEINDCKKLEDTICSSTIEGYLTSQCQFLENEIGFEIPSSDEIKVGGPFEQYSPKMSVESQLKIAELVTERLTATMPRLSKSMTKNLQPSSLSASISSQRKFKHFSGKNLNLSSSLPHKIRKTYPLYHVDSDSSSFSDSNSDKNVANSLRKTKSRGKGKNKELDIADLDDDML